ncbi:endoglucanase 1-like protein [Tanacetum coccineum]
MPTKMELTLEQTQQGVSYEVSFDEFDTYVLERFDTPAGNPVKKILLKLNLSDHRSILTDSKGQRSGKLPDNQRVTWRGDSALQDGYLANVDIVGGCYIAGDNVKYRLPMAFTMTMLTWSVIEFGVYMDSDYLDAIAALHWSTDYLLKAATTTLGVLYV